MRAQARKKEQEKMRKVCEKTVQLPAAKRFLKSAAQLAGEPDARQAPQLRGACSQELDRQLLHHLFFPREDLSCGTHEYIMREYFEVEEVSPMGNRNQRDRRKKTIAISFLRTVVSSWPLG